jgi:tetratricopeptide (TPR) repeat protein
MRFSRTGVSVFLSLTLFIFGCGTRQVAPPEPVQTEQPVSEEVTPEQSRDVTPEMVEEYAAIHQISDLKTAEFYLTHPEYAREHPYKPTPEDIAFYEGKFLEKVYPKFKALADRVGFMRARHIYMTNPPYMSNPISRRIGSERYGTRMQQLGSAGGEGASTGTTNPLLEADPAAVHYREAMKLYRQNQLDDAIERMELAVKAKPDSPTMHHNLGVMHMEKADYARAVKHLQTSIAHIKETGFTKVNLAMYPDVYMGAHVNLGLIYTRIGMYNEAVKMLKEAIRFRPDDVDANRNLGTTYYVMGDMEKAAAQMRKCISLDPDNAEAHNMIGLLYYRKEFYNAALDEFQIAARLDPDQKQYTYNAGLVLAKLGRHDEANEAFEEASGLEEGEDTRRVFAEQTAANKARDLYNEGHAAMRSLDLTRAMDIFKAVLKLKPDMMEAHFNLGVCYRMRGDKENQIHHFEEAARLSPDTPDVHYNLGLAYSDSGMYPEAIAEFDRAIELKPSLRDAHFSLGTVLYRLERYTDAAAEFRRCLELSPDWFEAHLNLGSCYMKTDDVDRAIDEFREAVRLKPDSAEAHYSLGAAYMNAERYDEASALFHKALEIDPSHRQARMMLKELETYQRE